MYMQIKCSHHKMQLFVMYKEHVMNIIFDVFIEIENINSKPIEKK